MSTEFDNVETYGMRLAEAKEKYAKLYDLHCGHDCDMCECKKWEVQQIQERYNFILEMTGEYK